MKLPLFVKTKLKEVCPQVYRDEAPENTWGLYITYSLEGYRDDIYKRDVDLEVRIWSERRAGVDWLGELDDIAETIERLFNGLEYTDADICVTFELADGSYRSPIPDPDKSFRGELLMFTIKKYER